MPTVNYDKICTLCGREFKGITRKCPSCALIQRKSKLAERQRNGQKPYQTNKTHIKYSKHAGKPRNTLYRPKNSFSDATRNLFFSRGYGLCYECGSLHADCLHHIMGRVSDSPYNAAPMNNIYCHLYNHKLGKKETKSKFLKITKEYLEDIGYESTTNDKDFLNKYRSYYE